MSKMVSARVPDPLYNEVSACLTSIGATPSDLVNAAFEYVLKEHALPGATMQGLQDKHKRRSLSEQQQKKLRNFFQECTLGIELPSDVSYAKNVARRARVNKYEDLA